MAENEDEIEVMAVMGLDLSDTKEVIKFLAQIALDYSRAQHEGETCWGCAMAALANSLAVVANQDAQLAYPIEDVVARTSEVIRDMRGDEKKHFH